MSKIFFIADTHFGSGELLRYENRPFESVEQMNKVIIANWNKAVSPDDIVWHLGDFGADGNEAEIISRLNGTKLLVRGNHDTQSSEYYRHAGFAEVYDYPVLFQSFWLLSHEPLYVNTNMPYANLFGHVHSNPMYRDLSPHHFCVCVERTDFAPIEFEQIKRKILESTT